MYKILVVEDELNVRENICEILFSYNFEVISAENGKVALELLNNFSPDLIVSDIMMPVMDGYQFYSECKNNEAWEDIPFIFLSAKSQPKDIREGMASGAEDYIIKPFRATDLINSINIRIDKRENSRKKLDIVKNDIARYVPHELRTPLISILGFSDIILSSQEELSVAEIIEMVTRIKRAGKRLHGLIEKFILFTELEFKLFDKNELSALREERVPGFDKSVKTIVSERSSFYERDEDPILELEPCNISGDTFFMEALLKEIIDNAFKFSPIGSPILISGKIVDNNYNLIVEDKGIGFDTTRINNLESFVQFNRNKTQQTGIGLGLVIVKKIVEMFEGRIMFKSESGKFTRVEVLLKLA